MPHETSHTSPSMHRRGPSTNYVAMWAMLALGASAYLGWLAVHPDVLARGEPGLEGQGSPAESNEGQRAMSDTLAEVRSIREGLTIVQKDVAELKTEMAASTELSVALRDRVAALETPAKSGMPVATAPAATSKTADAKPADAKAAEKPTDTKPVAAADTVAAPKEAPATPKVINAAPAKSLETGSVAAAALGSATERPAVVFGPAVVKPTPKAVGVQIATGPSLDSLRLSWSLLSDRHADVLKSLEARYTGSDQSAYELVAGPVKSASDAKRICATLQAKSVPCKPVDYDGNPL